MPSRTTIINLGGVNCYLLAEGDGYVLIDTGFQGKRAQLEKSLENAGCKPGKLRLVVLTHGDADHVGNAAFIRSVYFSKIAMHSLDTGMVQEGDMSRNRKEKPDKMSIVARMMAFVVGTFFKAATKFDKFTPDLLIDEGFDLSTFGLKAKILHIPGHSQGSIGILTEDGKLFCGDFAYNIPGFGFIDDMTDHDESMEKLLQHKIDLVYPGHGKPFPMDLLIKRT